MHELVEYALLGQDWGVEKLSKGRLAEVLIHPAAAAWRLLAPVVFKGEWRMEKNAMRVLRAECAAPGRRDFRSLRTRVSLRSRNVGIEIGVSKMVK